MPQISGPYAAGRVACLTRTMIPAANVERLAGASTSDEVARLLAELGWGEASNRAEAEALAQAHVRDACALLRSITPDAALTDCFLYKYDVMNLKLLVKSRAMGAKAGELSACGTIPPETLRHAVAEGRYKNLPDALHRALDAIEKKCALAFDPLFADAALDAALFEMIFSSLGKKRCPEVRAYFQAAVDFVNLMIALRTHAMGKDASFARALAIEGGTLDKRDVEKIARDPEAAHKLVKDRPYARGVRSALDAYQKGGTLALMEKKMDDYQLSLLRKGRHDLGGVLPLIGYLVAREREASMVRLLVTAKAVHLAPDKLAERLRETYA